MKKISLITFAICLTITGFSQDLVTTSPAGKIHYAQKKGGDFKTDIETYAAAIVSFNNTASRGGADSITAYHTLVNAFNALSTYDVQKEYDQNGRSYWPVNTFPYCMAGCAAGYYYCMLADPSNVLYCSVAWHGCSVACGMSAVNSTTPVPAVMILKKYTTFENDFFNYVDAMNNAGSTWTKDSVSAYNKLVDAVVVLAKYNVQSEYDGSDRAQWPLTYTYCAGGCAMWYYNCISSGYHGIEAAGACVRGYWLCIDHCGGW